MPYPISIEVVLESKSDGALSRKECYAIFLNSFKQLEHMLRDCSFTLRTDHRNLLYLNAQASSKVTRWKLAIQEHYFLIEHIPGPLNIVANAMSRLCPGGDKPVITTNTVVLCMARFSSSEPVVQCNARKTRAAPARRSVRLSYKVYTTHSKCHSGPTGQFGKERTVFAAC
jgi:hypothetical protein